MHYSSQTPYVPDPAHVMSVMGVERFIACFDKPVADWGLTPDECAAILRGPHGQKAVYILDTDYYGFTVQDWIVECQCGESFTNRLLSRSLAAYDAHAGTAVSHVHTADMLES